MRWSSRWSWPTLLLFAAVAYSLAAGTLSAQQAAAPGKALTEPHDAADLYNSLRDVINYGAELFNKQADHAGCYRVYQGSLIAVRPFLAPEVRKKIDETIIRAEGLPYYSERAFELRRMLDEVRSKATPGKNAPKVATPGKTAPVTTGAAPSPGLPTSRPNTDAPKPVVEAPKVEAPKGELPKITETPKPADPPKVVVPPVSPPKVEAPKLEPKPVEPPLIEVPAVQPAPAPKKVELPKVTTPKVEAPKVEPPKLEIPKIELPTLEPKKAAAPKVDKKTELPKVDLPKIELPKVETPKGADLPKIELPKPSLPQPELPKPSLPKVEAPKVEQPKDPLVIPPPLETPKEKKTETAQADPPPLIELPSLSGKEQPAPTVKGMVSGTILLEGKPLPAGFFVTLVSAEGKRFSTLVQKDGVFQFTSGVAVGNYKVAVEPLPGDDGKLAPIPPRYRDEATSGLSLQVTAGKVTPELRLAK